MNFIAFLERHMLPCPFKALLHIDCPGCGMQRSFICLLKGDFKASLALHPATILVIVLLLFAAAHLIVRFRKGGKIIVVLQLGVAITTMVFYIYKIVQHQIFI